MNRVGQYISRALRAYETREWDDLLLQLCPCIDAASSFEYGTNGRSSFRRFVDDNFYIASMAGFGPEIQSFSVTIRVRDVFDDRVVSELSKVQHLPEEWSIEGNDHPALVKAKKEAELSRQKLLADLDKAGAMCVPFGHILYHCLRCELLHKPNAPEVISFHDERVVDNNNFKLALPIGILWGFILATVLSPAFADETYELDETIFWNGFGGHSRFSWLWGQRQAFKNLVKLNRQALNE